MHKEFSEYAHRIKDLKEEKLQERARLGQLRKQVLQPVHEFIMALQHQYHGFWIVHHARFPGSDYDRPACVLSLQEVPKPLTITCDPVGSNPTSDGKLSGSWTFTFAVADGSTTTVTAETKGEELDYDKVYTVLSDLIADLQAEHTRMDRYLDRTIHHMAEQAEETS